MPGNPDPTNGDTVQRAQKLRRLRAVVLTGLSLGIGSLCAAVSAAPAALVPQGISDEAIFDGVTVSNDGRILAVFPHIDGSRGMFIGGYGRPE